MSKEDKFWACVLIAIQAAILAVMLCGCASAPVVYIQQEDAARRYTLEGKPGWWLPDSTFARLMELAIRNSASKQECKP